ncbi:MAG: GntR family transcriptional regulator [Muribaculaceae bacterium]|nr:GntR family transcriptional regulator [Bacteroides sp.]MDE6032471.1 GntR family transcriptional regulator [Muribaculaceae bacterium]MDE6262520.1 GntR family transcriptional regulator [Muribaculaceae bacterium]
MVNIGQFNRLKVSRLADFGAYLDAGNDVEILIPTRYLDGVTEVGQELNVFVYTDSEDRLIATTEQPLIQVGQFGFLQVKDVNQKVGAFLEWVPSKDLLCPFSEQRVKMTPGNVYLVYAYLDDTTKRVVASAKVEKFLGNVYPDYRPHQRVNVLVVQRTEIGYKVIVDGKHWGMLYVDELIQHPEIGSSLTAYVKKVREDGKIDVTMKDTNGRRAKSTADVILELMHENGGFIALNDKSSPEEIAEFVGCSKKDFKKSIGLLYKERKIRPEGSGWRINP